MACRDDLWWPLDDPWWPHVSPSGELRDAQCYTPQGESLHGRNKDEHWWRHRIIYTYFYTFSHSCCRLSLRDVWWDQSISHSPSFASLLSWIVPFQVDFRTKNTYSIVGYGEMAWSQHTATRRHSKPSSKDWGLMWWLVLRWAHPTFQTMPYAYNLVFYQKLNQAIEM